MVFIVVLLLNLKPGWGLRIPGSRLQSRRTSACNGQSDDKRPRIEEAVLIPTRLQCPH